MSNERLERIKERVNYHGHLDDDIEWLIKQAERVQELEEFNRILSSDKSMFIEELVREQHQNKRYREALESIANNDETYLLSHEIACKALEREG